jgi:hypothetical protein
LVFFIGPAKDYFDILNATYQSIKNADNNAIVLKGGMAGVMNDNTEFWSEVFTLGGSNYFDIGNIHSINSDSDAINGPEYKQFLDDQGIEKTYWITEVELSPIKEGNGVNQEINISNFLITSFVKAFESGAEKIFHPGIMKVSKKSEPEKESTYNALQTIIQKIDYFESVEKIRDGQYKFILESNVIYVLWNDTIIPEEIVGQVKITDVSGTETIVDSADIELSDSPVFIEII